MGINMDRLYVRGQTEPKRRFSLSFTDSRLFLETKHMGNADFRRNR